MQAILLFSNDKSKQLFRSDMYSFPSLFNVFLSFFLFLSLPFFSLLRFTFSFLLRSLLHSLSLLSIFSRISISVFLFFYFFPIFPLFSLLFL